MTEQEWLASTDPQVMLRLICGPTSARKPFPVFPPSDRKLRLFQEARWWEGFLRTDKDQADLLRCIFGNPWRPVVLAPEEPANIFAALDVLASEWKHSERQYIKRQVLARNNRTVPTLARLIYESRGFEDMPILADALEEAGCTNEDILDHCRGMSRHQVRLDDGILRETRLPDSARHVRGCWVLDLLLGKE